MPLIDARTRVVTLLGHPVEHSLSPLIHNTAFRHQGLNYVYVATPVAPDMLEMAVSGIRALHFAGANVTIPHKQAVMALLDAVSDQARAVGSVNTISLQGSGDSEVLLCGDNTDVSGFLKPLASYESRLKNADMLVFGAGGAARAVIYGLLTAYQPRRLVIAARSTGRAEKLARDFSHLDSRGGLSVVPLTDAAAAIRSSTLLINSTPIGMYPDVDATIWPEITDFHRDQIAYDLVYNPVFTRWLDEIRSRGAVIISGLEMFIAQADEAYRKWTGRGMPIDAVRKALDVWQSDQQSTLHNRR